MSDDDVLVPFIPDDDLPVIPNSLVELKAYRFRTAKNAWKHMTYQQDEEEKTYPTSVRIITWNIEFSTNHRVERLNAALRHIETDVLGCKEGQAPEPCCILLQEMHSEVMEHLLQDNWVRRYFAVFPISTRKWPEDADYGNVTLVARSLTVVRSQILHFGLSQFQRTGVLVYIKLSAPPPKAREDVICVINTHLESLEIGTEARPHQLKLLARILKSDNCQGGLVAGDMNAIMPCDATIAKEAGLHDAWKKGDKDPAGFTWGYQGGGNYPAARLDKVLYLPKRGYKLDEPRRIGVDAKVNGDKGTWISDHYGLDTMLRMYR